MDKDSLGKSVFEDRVRQRFRGEEQIPVKEDFRHGQSSARKLVNLNWFTRRAMTVTMLATDTDPIWKVSDTDQTLLWNLIFYFTWNS